MKAFAFLPKIRTITDISKHAWMLKYGQILISISVNVMIYSNKATDYKLLVSRPGESMESMRAGDYYYYYLEYYYCTIQH